LSEHPGISHGPLRILFTCDEEIGRGVQHVDLNRVGADVCYTLDGEGAGRVDVETFSADLATIHIHGVNIHPSIAKGRMVNAVRAAGMLLAGLPQNRLAPEVTDGREGFIHAYQVTGGVAEVVIRAILRDFDTPKLNAQADLLRSIAHQVQLDCPGIEIEVVVSKQYRNMGEGLRKEPRAVEFVRQAYQRLDRPMTESIVRGGTDGSQLTERGLPTPNLSCGQHNPHSPLEWACLEEMVQATELLVELAQVWGEAG
jgi:tripeptide aminopeptidase